jgi:hypothetical protein
MKTKNIDTTSAKMLLRDFYLAARKEISRASQIGTKVGATDESANLHFIGDDFDLHFVLKAKGGNQ